MCTTPWVHGKDTSVKKNVWTYLSSPKFPTALFIIIMIIVIVIVTVTGNNI